MSKARILSSVAAIVAVALAYLFYRPKANSLISNNIIQPQSYEIEPKGCSSLPEYGLSRVLPQHYANICNDGWFPVQLNTTQDGKVGSKDELYDSLMALFASSRTFFDMPESYKEQFMTDLGPAEGWSRVEGEKEMLTLHTLDKTPDEVKTEANRVWSNAANLLDGYLEKMSLALGLSAEVLTSFSKPNIIMDNVRRSTELRLFRYENQQPKVVSGLHADLGLLSLVVGDIPGLEVMNIESRTMVPIEKMYTSPAATITMGRELRFLSGNHYHAGPHEVRAYGRNSTACDAGEISEHDAACSRYRHSIVFVMRAHWPVLIDLDKMTTAITGRYESLVTEDSKGNKVERRQFTAGDLFAKFRSGTVNVNSQQINREKDRERLQEEAKAQASSVKA